MTAHRRLVTAIRAFARAHADWQRACVEIAALDALQYREGFMRARNAERRDWERVRDSALRRMRAACREVWGIVYGLEIAA